MKKIPLTQGQFAIVDDEDFEFLNQWKWYAGTNSTELYYYAMRHSSSKGGVKRQYIRMHRVILGLEQDDARDVDHIDHDTLNNKRNNLRAVSRRKNSENRKRASKHGSGVYLNPKLKSKPFEARAFVNGSNRFIGRFATAKEARRARRKFLEESGE